MKPVLLWVGMLLALTLVAAAFAWWWLLRPQTLSWPEHQGALRERTTQHGDRLRTWQLYLPGNGRAASGLMVVLHGSRQSGKSFRRWTAHGLDALADRHGFAVAYLDGVEGHWNDCRKQGNFAAKTLRIDDVGFLRSVIDTVSREHGIAPRRTALLGYSNGGHMALRFALEGAGDLAAVVMVGASVPADENFICAAGKVAAPVMLVSGTQDPINPYEGGRVVLLGSDRGSVRSAMDSARWLAGPDAQEVAMPGGGLPAAATSSLVVEDRLWRSTSGPPVRLVTVLGGGHTVPQPHVRFPRLLGDTAMHFDVLAQAVTFAGLASGIQQSSGAAIASHP